MSDWNSPEGVGKAAGSLATLAGVVKTLVGLRKNVEASLPEAIRPEELEGLDVRAALGKLATTDIKLIDELMDILKWQRTTMESFDKLVGLVDELRLELQMLRNLTLTTKKKKPTKKPTTKKKPTKKKR